MNKLDFLRRLDKYLAVLEKEERREILSFYEERFYNGTIYENKTEEEVISELESPEVIARNVLEEYGVSNTYVKNKEERYTNISTFKVIMLLCYDFIVGFWLIPTLFTVAVSVIGSSFTYVTTWGIMIGERTTVDEFVFAFVTGGYILLFMFGLVVLEAAFNVLKKTIIWHLNVFKLKNRDKAIKKLNKLSVDRWFKRHRKLQLLKNLAVVFAIVSVVYTGQWIYRHFDWVQVEYGNGELVEGSTTEDFATEINDGDVWEIVTDIDDMRVQIVSVSGTDVNLSYSNYEDYDFSYTFDYENNKIKIINESDNFQIFWDLTELFMLFGPSQVVRIEVPSALELGDTVIKTGNGKVDINNVDFSSLDIETSNGDINLANIDLGSDLTADTSNGAIIIRDIRVVNTGTLKADTSNGRIDIEDVDFDNYVIHTSNGGIDLDRFNTELQDGHDISVTTSNGTVHMDDIYVDDITIHTSNGSIYFYNEDLTFRPTDLDVSTSNGQINTSVREK